MLPLVAIPLRILLSTWVKDAEASLQTLQSLTLFVIIYKTTSEIYIYIKHPLYCIPSYGRDAGLWTIINIYMVLKFVIFV